MVRALGNAPLSSHSRDVSHLGGLCRYALVLQVGGEKETEVVLWYRLYNSLQFGRIVESLLDELQRRNFVLLGKCVDVEDN